MHALPTLEGLDSPDPRTRFAAEDRLRAAGQRGVDDLRRALGDSSVPELLRERGTDLLGWILHDAAVDAFRAATPAPEAAEVWAGAVAIGVEDRPDLDAESSNRRLEEIVTAARAAVPADAPVEERARRLTSFLHEDLGFRGDDVTYGDVRNSYVADVLVRRRGIPVTLAVLWIAVANRLGLAAAGVGLPLHFVARCEGKDGPVFIDAFHGTLLDADGCRRLVAKAAGREVVLPDRALRPLRPPEVLTRMLRNLRAAHEREGRLPMALAAVDRLLHLEPLDVSTLKDRAILLARLSRPGAAARALSRAVALLPEGGEREALARIRGRLLRDAAARN